MRRAVVVSPVLLVLAVAAVALPPGARAAPIVTETTATEAARDRVTRIQRYSERHPDAPGAFAPWAAGPVELEPPLLVHSYPSLKPSYYYVPLTSAHGGGSFVTLSTGDGQWQAYGRRAAGFPSVARGDAALTFGCALGLAVKPEALRVVSMPDKRLHWLWRSPDGASELLISLSDTLRARVDARSLAPASDTAEGPLRRTPGPGLPGRLRHPSRPPPLSTHALQLRPGHGPDGDGLLGSPDPSAGHRRCGQHGHQRHRCHGHVARGTLQRHQLCGPGSWPARVRRATTGLRRPRVLLVAARRERPGLPEPAHGPEDAHQRRPIRPSS